MAVQSAISLEQAQAQLTALLAAQLALTSGAQSYSIAGRAVTKANMREIGEQITFYTNLVNRLQRGGGPRVRQIVPF